MEAVLFSTTKVENLIEAADATSNPTPEIFILDDSKLRQVGGGFVMTGQY
jgi:hypothetical protein